MAVMGAGRRFFATGVTLVVAYTATSAMDAPPTEKQILRYAQDDIPETFSTNRYTAGG